MHRLLYAIAAAIGLSALAHAQVDTALTGRYFSEAAALCQKEAGRLWGTSLCGPIVIYDPATKTIATNQPPPTAPKPAVLGYANAAMDWGGTRWTTLSWQIMLTGGSATDSRVRGRLMLHELFHRVQPQLKLLGEDGNNGHLDTLDGRYLLQLEWRALAKALASQRRPRRGGRRRVDLPPRPSRAVPRCRGE
jgi:hypothetical protein